MPFVRATILPPGDDPQLVGRLQAGLARLAIETLGKAGDLVSVLIEPIRRGCWHVGGTAAAIAAHVTITVTAGTNSSDQKAAFIAQTHALLYELLGEALPEATYVVVEEIAADSWGYGGATAAVRRLPAAS